MSEPPSATVLLIGIRPEEIFTKEEGDEVSYQTVFDERSTFMKGERSKFHRSGKEQSVLSYSLEDITSPFGGVKSHPALDSLCLEAYTKRLKKLCERESTFTAYPFHQSLTGEFKIMVYDENYAEKIDQLRDEWEEYNHDLDSISKVANVIIGKLKYDYSPELEKGLKRHLVFNKGEWVKEKLKTPIQEMEIKGNCITVKGIGNVNINAPIIMTYNEDKGITSIMYRTKERIGKFLQEGRTSEDMILGVLNHYK